MPTPEEIEAADLFLGKAASDVAAARSLAADANQADDVVGFHAQQAVEKAFKAVVAVRSLEIPRSHDIGLLLRLLDPGEGELPKEIGEADWLNPWAVTMRYDEPGTEFDRSRAVQVARRALTGRVRASIQLELNPSTNRPTTPSRLERGSSWSSQPLSSPLNRLIDAIARRRSRTSDGSLCWRSSGASVSSSIARLAALAGGAAMSTLRPSGTLGLIWAGIKSVLGLHSVAGNTQRLPAVRLGAGRAVAPEEVQTLQGRLADPARTLATDPRVDPRVIEALAPFGLDGLTPSPPVTASSPRDDQLAFLAEAEERLEAMLSAVNGELPAVAGVRSDSITIIGEQGEIALYIDVPDRLDRRVPCVVHLHGGGMVILQATNPVYAYWRGRLAATDIVVIGVEFRNGAGRLGCHPFPAGLNDCAAATRWALSNLEQLGASHVVVSGESGGGNLTLALAHKSQPRGLGQSDRGVLRPMPLHLRHVGEPTGGASLPTRERPVLYKLRSL